MNRPIVVWWAKRDLRLGDNAVLTEAARLGAVVVPFFCFEPRLMRADDTSAMHLHAQGQALTHLRAALREQRAELLLAHGEVTTKLAKLHEQIPFTHVFAHEEIGNNLTFRRDREVAAWCRERGIEYREFPQSSVRRGGVNRDRLQELWRTRIVDALPLPIPTLEQTEAIRRLAARSGFPSDPAFAENPQFQPVSESAAHATLTDFLQRRSLWYRGGISSPNTADTAASRLSVHLAWGTITGRQVWHAVQARLRDLDPQDPTAARHRAGLEAFVSRLHWRDHFIQRLESEPELEFRSIHPCYRAIPYENDDRLFSAWREGRTGYPLVDAVMRCLAETGFINFRMRAMVVSFACHVLHLDWRVIHPHLARVFRDYEPGIHLSQLQMQAGVVGWNAIRVYNPMKQLADWDAEARFVKRRLPELRNIPAERIRHADTESLPNYPRPIVPFAPRAKWMTDLLYAIRKTAEAQAATPAVYRKHGSRRREPPRRTKQPKPQPTLFEGLDTE